MGEFASHIFVELTSLEELSFPTSASNRVKYTCLGASPHYLAVGSSSGTVYLFSRYAAKYRKSLSSVPVQVIACKEGPVCVVKASPNEEYLGVGTARGAVCVVGLGGSQPSVLLHSSLHLPTPLSTLAWASDSSTLYVGDTAGRVSASRVSSRNMFRAASEFVLEAECGIVQLDVKTPYLLVSTLSRSYLYHASKGSCTQIGKKLRSGRFGACFLETEEEKDPLIFAARPGSRLWEVDCEGTVYSTHSFGKMGTVPQAPLITYRKPMEIPSEDSLSEQNSTISFEELHIIDKKFLLSVSDSRLCVVDPQRAAAILVCHPGEEITEYSLCGFDFFFLTKQDGALRKISLFPVEKSVEKLQWRECYIQAGQVIAYLMPPAEKVPWKAEVLIAIIKQIKKETRGNYLHLLSKIEPWLARVQLQDSEGKGRRAGVKSAVKLPTGVHRVLKLMENSGYEDDFTFRAPSPLRNPLKHKSRSSPLMRDRPLRSSDDSKLGSEPVEEKEGMGVMVGSRSEESLLALVSSLSPSQLHTSAPTPSASSLNDLSHDAPVRAVQPATSYTEFVPLRETLEDKMMRSIGVGGMKVLGSVQKMAISLATEDYLRQKPVNQQVPTLDPSLPPLPHHTPSSLLPEVPTVKRGKQRRKHHNYSSQSTKGKKRGERNVVEVDEMNNSHNSVPNSPIPHSTQTNGNGSPDLMEERQGRTSRSQPITFCPQCGVHKSWILLPLLRSAVGAVSVNPAWFQNGGIPLTLAEWKTVLDEKVEGEDLGGCPLCAAASASLHHGCGKVPPETKPEKPLLASSSKNMHNFELFRGQQWLKPNPVLPLPVESPDPIDPADRNYRTEEEMIYSTYMNPVYDSTLTSTGSIGNRGVPNGSRTKLPLHQILAAMSCVLDPPEIETLLLSFPGLPPLLDESCWRALAGTSPHRYGTPAPLQTMKSALLEDVGAAESTPPIIANNESFQKIDASGAHVPRGLS